MLSLTRREGERIMIGDDIVIQVSKIRSGTVQIDILAPRDVPVHREEVYHRIQAEIEAEGLTATRPRRARTGSAQ